MKHIDGIMLKQMIISGANYLFNCYPEVDALNVFPVPDGDTGTNMNLTMQSGAKEVQNRGLDINYINYIDKSKSKFTIDIYSVIGEYKKVDLKKIIQSQRKNRVNRTSKKIFSSRER